MASDSDDDDYAMMETLVVLTANSVRNMQRHRTMAEWALLLTTMLDDDSDGSDGPRMKRCRTVKPRPDYDSAWGTMLRNTRRLANRSCSEGDLGCPTSASSSDGSQHERWTWRVGGASLLN